MEVKLNRKLAPPEIGATDLYRIFHEGRQESPRLTARVAGFVRAVLNRRSSRRIEDAYPKSRG